eukprot:SAG31_NODE_545_length_14238_cov_15.518849_4_plen_188_part_00
MRAGHSLVCVRHPVIDSRQMFSLGDAAIVVVGNIGVDLKVHGTAVENFAECFNVFTHAVNMCLHIKVQTVAEANLLQALNSLGDEREVGFIVSVCPACVHVFVWKTMCPRKRTNEFRQGARDGGAGGRFQARVKDRPDLECNVLGANFFLKLRLLLEAAPEVRHLAPVKTATALKSRQATKITQYEN